MKLVGRDKLDAFCRKHTDARKWIESWLSEVEAVTWASPQQIKDRYASASFLAGNVIIFNVKGNEYRLEINVAFRSAVVVVLWIGTHPEYDERNKGR